MATLREFIGQVLPEAERLATLSGIPKEFFLTHWSIETGNGGPRYQRTHNLGNYTVGSGTTVPGGWPGTKDKINSYGLVFRIYATDTQSATDYYGLLQRAYQPTLIAARQNLHDGFVALAASGWDAGHYTGGQNVVTGTGNVLFTRYDQVAAVTGGRLRDGPPVVKARMSMLDIARSQIGKRETGRNINPYAAEVGEANGQPWCATFVVWCARRAGVRLAVESADTTQFLAVAKGNGTFRSPDIQAQPGWLILFDFVRTDNRGTSHVGIVESDDGRNVTSIDGNTSIDGSPSDGVFRRKRARSAAFVGFVAITPNELAGNAAGGAGNTSGDPTAPGAVRDPAPLIVPDLPADEAGYKQMYNAVLAGLGIEGLEQRVQRMTVSMATSQVSELTLTLNDPGLDVLRSGALIVQEESATGTPGAGTEWSWFGWRFVLAVLQASGGSAGTGQLDLTFRSAAIQKLRQTRPVHGETFTGKTPTTVLHGWLPHLVAQNTQPRTLTVNAAKNTSDQGRGESYWEAALRWAEETGFVLFEAADTGYFAKPSWLLNGAGLTFATLAWRGRDTDDGIVRMPTVRHTADNYRDPVTVNVSVLGQLGIKFRPGSGVELTGMGQFDGRYLVTDINGDVAPDSVWTLTASTAVDPTPNKAEPDLAASLLAPASA